jgi:hypothetical protein
LRDMAYQLVDGRVEQVVDDGDGRGRGRESRARDSSRSEQLSCPDKELCDKNRVLQ